MIRFAGVVATIMIIILAGLMGCGWWMWDDTILPRFSTATQTEETRPRYHYSQETTQQEQILSPPSLSSASSTTRRLPFWHEIPEDPAHYYYTYDSYLRDLPDKLIASEREYQLRKTIFDTNWAFIWAHNTDNNGNGGHLLGLNEFMDRFEQELPQAGYDKTHHKAWNQNAIDPSIRTVSDATAGRGTREVRGSG